jgi:hypothetical protein
MIAVDPKQPNGFIPTSRCFLRAHDHGNNLILDAGVLNVRKKLRLGDFSVPLFKKYGMRIDGVYFFFVGLRRAARQSNGRFAFPTANLDDRSFTTI